MMDSYKSQLATLESKNNDLALSNSRSEHELKNTASKMEYIESNKSRDEEHIHALEEKIRELELLGHPAVGAMKEENLHNRTLSSTLDATMLDSASSDLKIKLARVEKECEGLRTRLQNVGGDAQRVAVLEQLLEDANLSKSKYQQDFLAAHQKNLELEMSMERFRQGDASAKSGHCVRLISF